MTSQNSPSQDLIEFKSQQTNPELPQVNDITAEELNEKLKQNSGRIHLIDVRQPEEFVGELGHIENARLIVLNTLADHIEEIPKNETVVFVCRSGGRSARATAFALENGLKHVYNMQGGMLRWNALEYKVTGKE